MMDYAFSHRDLRGEEDVSDLELDLLFWRRVTSNNYLIVCSRHNVEDRSKLDLGWRYAFTR